MTDIAVFTQQQARETWDTIKLLRSSGMLRNLSAFARPDDPGIHHVWVKNTSGEEIPPFACMQIDGTEVIGELTYLKVKKPDTTESQYIFNHDNAIEDDGHGMCLPWGVVRMLGDIAGENIECGATSGDWSIQEQSGGPFVVYGPDNTREGIVKGRIAAGSGGGSSNFVVFQFDEDEYNEGPPELCADKSPTDATSHRVFVTNNPCGGSVPGIDDEGYITVTDPGEFLKDRDYRDLPGRVGFAQRVSSDNDYEYSESSCQWVITWINFFREITMVQNIIFKEKSILIKRKKIVVWDDCFLPDEEIDGTDCADDDYYEGS
jgi:hypothetical protein